MKLQLKKTETKILELELPGGVVTLEIKGVTMKQASDNGDKVKAIESDFKKGKITAFEHIDTMCGIIFSNWEAVKKDVFDFGLEDVHLGPIMESVRDLRENKPVDEKKTP